MWLLASSALQMLQENTYQMGQVFPHTDPKVKGEGKESEQEGNGCNCEKGKSPSKDYFRKLLRFATSMNTHLTAEEHLEQVGQSKTPKKAYFSLKRKPPSEKRSIRFSYQSVEKLSSVVTDVGGILWQKIPRVGKVSSVPNQEETTMCSPSSRKTTVVRFVRKQKTSRARCRKNLRSAWTGLHLLQTLETWSRQISKDLNVETRVEMRTQQSCNRARWCHELDSKLSDEEKGNMGNTIVFTEISSSVTEEGNWHRQFQIIDCFLSGFARESWHQHPSSPRKERSDGKPSTERRNSDRTRARRTARSMVGLCDGMLLLLAQRARWDDRWQDSIRAETWPDVWRTINSFWNIGWRHPNHRVGQVKSTSFLKEHSERNVHRQCAACAEVGWSGDFMIADYERFARIRGLRILRQKIHKPRSHCLQKETSSQIMMLKPKKKIRGLRVVTMSRHHEKSRLKFYDPDNETFSIPLKYVGVMRQNSDEFTQCLCTYYQWLMDRSEKCHSFWGVDWDYKVPDLTYKTSRRIQVGKWKLAKIQMTTRPENGLKFGLNFPGNKENRLQDGQKKVSNRNQHTEVEESMRCWPMTKIISRWLLTFVWNWKNLAMSCIKKDDSRGKPQAVATSVDASEEQTSFRKYRSIRKSEAATYVPHRRKRYVGSVHYGLVQKPVCIQEALKIPEATAAVDKAWENSRAFQHAMSRRWDQSMKLPVRRIRMEKTVHFDSLTDFCHLKYAEFVNHLQKYEERVVLWWDNVKDEEGTEQYSPKVFQPLRGQRQSSWTPFRSFLVWLEKHVTQFPRTLRSKWPKLPDCHDQWKMEWSFWHKIAEIDRLCQQNPKLQIILWCGEPDWRLQTWFLPRCLNFRWFARFRTSVTSLIVRIWITLVCSNFVDVQEANRTFSQPFRVWNCFARRRLTYGWVTSSSIWRMCLGNIIH